MAVDEEMSRGTQVAADFARNGFAVAEDIADRQTLQELRSVYDGMLDGSVPCPGTDRKLGGVTRQIMLPHLHHPSFAKNAALERALELARQLLQVSDPEFVFSMLIYKPPGHPHATPWHQDMAYAAKPTTPLGVALDNNAIVQFWLALDDVDDAMGCMEFIPSPPDNAMLPHYVASGGADDDGRLLAIENPERHIDAAQAVKCPLRAGSATVHGYTTAHYTGPNRSTRGRRAYIFSFANPAKLKQALAAIGRPV
jgi:ectoine hydroxylase-related dioxygenase (phytanoyl-CoA dioxygenase family)